MALKRGDTGLAVKKLQNQLIDLGYALPRWGADGDLGDESLSAVAQCLLEHGRVVDPSYNIVDDGELAFIEQLHLALSVPIPPDFCMPPVIDRRMFAGLTKDFGPRAWTEVKGWCLHQTACNLNASSDVARCDKVGAHFVIYPDGRVFWLHDLDRKIIHGNGWNNQTIGIEIDGLFAGIEGDSTTVWDDPSTPYKEKAGSVTDAQIKSTLQLIRWGTTEVARHNGRVTKCVPHRSASLTRRNDPGSKVWQTIALPISKELGLDDGGVGFKIGGYPVPEVWDSRCKGIKY